MGFKTQLKRSLATIALGTEKLVRGNPACTPEDLRSFRDFLFLQYMMPLGYCVHDTPIYEALRTCLPDAKITVATRGTGFETLRHNPYIDNLIVTADPLIDTVKAARELRTGLSRCGVRPQVGITNFSNPRTRLTLLNMLSGRHVRLGHTLAPELYHLPQKYDRGMSLIHNNLCLVTVFHCATGHVEPRVFFSESDLAKARALLAEAGISAERPLTLLVTQNSGGQRTGWHPERFAQVIRHISQRSQIVFVGTKTDIPAIEALRTRAALRDDARAASLAGRTSIPELSALLCLSDCVVTLDTGTMHVGRAAGVPMVVLGPSWQKPLEWLPLGVEHVRILRGEDIDHVPANYQLDEIEVSHATAAFDELMTAYPWCRQTRDARVAKSTSNVDHRGN
jgi:ADP-heptose:LPS heptosyltransferase